MRNALLCVVLVATTVLVARTAPAQAGRGGGAGVDREAMWPAPTAEDWRKPCLVQWQRSYEDAVAVSQETRKPILVCVNMDGEIASEHYAGIRYRQPEIAQLYAPYVCVIASVYRHQPRDYDDEGERIPCPRFGTVTCGEHIAIEPGLFEKFMDGQRIAPRHIAVELDGAEVYDVFYAWDTDTIFNSLRDGIANRKTTPNTVVRGDRPLVERVASRDSQDRSAVEAAYVGGDPALRKALLEAAVATGEGAPVDLLRLAVFGFDTDLSRLARKALARSAAPEATGLIAEALRVPLEASEQEALVGALTRLGTASPKARTLAVVYRGLASRSSALDVEGWGQALARAPAASEASAESESDQIAARLANQDELLASGDAAARLDLAEAYLARALAPDADEKFARLLFMDAEQTARAAARLGATGWRVHAVLAVAAARLGRQGEARDLAEKAVRELPAAADGRTALIVLELFAQARERSIGDALRAKTTWPPEWLTDLNAAYTLIARHPLGTDAHVATHYDVLKWFGAAGAAGQFLTDGLARFPASDLLHARLRTRALEEKGVAGLESVYAALLQKLQGPGASAALEGFAGYAALVAAEFHRRSQRDAEALAAYDRGIAHYERALAANPEERVVPDHYIALALAGRARIAYEAKDLDGALTATLASFARRGESAATLDGLNISPVDTAKMLLARLKELKRDAAAAQLEAALGGLDPELLQLPAYERDGRDAGSGGADRRAPAGGQPPPAGGRH